MSPTIAGVAPMQEIVDDIRAGRMVILVDDEDRENEGDLVIAGAHVTPEAINFMARFGRGLICLTLDEARCRQLALAPMVSDNRSPMGTNFTVSIEAATGVTTGISAHDRARTVQAAVAPDARPSDIVQPGHIFPLRARPGGVLVRAGHTEAGCDLAALAGLVPAAVICEILNEDGSMARLPDLLGFAREHGLRVGTIADLIQYRSRHERLVERVAERTIATRHGAWRVIAYHDATVGQTHLALVKGHIRPEAETLVRVHEPLSVVDFLEEDSARHSFAIPRAMGIMEAAGSGVVVLLRGPEGPRDLIEDVAGAAAAAAPQAKWDPRMYGIGAQILRDVGVGRMRILASPRRMPSMAGFGLEVTGYMTPEAGT